MLLSLLKTKRNFFRYINNKQKEKENIVSLIREVNLSLTMLKMQRFSTLPSPLPAPAPLGPQPWGQKNPG